MKLLNEDENDETRGECKAFIMMSTKNASVTREANKLMHKI